MQPGEGISAAYTVEGNAVAHLKGNKTEWHVDMAIMELYELDGTPFWTVCHTSGFPILHNANP